MNIKKVILSLLLAVPLLYGCAKAPVAVDLYQPVVKLPNQKIETISNQLFITHLADDYTVRALLAGSKNIMIVYLIIENKTGLDLAASDYSVRLTDGRDHQPMELISRDVVVKYRAQVETGGKIASGNSIVDLALTQLSSMANSVGSSELSRFITSIDWAIDHYFAFRPIYANQSREGVLCYTFGFVREYPLTLQVKIKDQTTNFTFLPIKK